VSVLLLDSSVWLAWARAAGEPDHAAAASILERRRRRELELRLLDLTVYELGNVVLRGWRRSAEDADGLVAAVLSIAATAPLVPSAAERRHALELAEHHALSAYDAAYAAVASARGLRLVSGDAALCDVGLAARPADA
jgi:predicted nucleic acid-binding protein